MGQQLESLGWFDPRKNESGFNKERIAYWLGTGAKLSATANNLLVKAKVIAGKKVAAHKKAKKKAEEKAAAPAAK